MKKIIFALAVVSVGAFAFVLLGSLGSDADTDHYQEAFKSGYGVYQPVIPLDANIAGEVAPTHIWYVRENLEREILVNMYWQSQTILHLKRANRFLPEARRIFKANGVPEDLVYISIVESGLQNLTSPAGAKGYWQFMKATGQSYDLEINKEVDERLHFTKSATAAAMYLKDAFKQFGSWTLAAAAYNRGSGGLSAAMKKQDVKTFYELWLNNETSRYIYRLLAIKTIMEDPAAYGFRLRKMDLYPELEAKSVKVSSSIENLAAFAKEHGSNLRELREYNPWLISTNLTVQSNTYYVLFPDDDQLKYPDNWFDDENREMIGTDSTGQE